MSSDAAAKPEGTVKVSSVVDNEHGVSIIRVDGLVKWFDIGRGYGFIIPDNGLPDILLHLSCLKRDGFDAPLEGSRVTCEVVARQKGFQWLR